MEPLHTHGKIEGLKEKYIYKVLETHEIKNTHIDNKDILVYLHKEEENIIDDLIKQGVSGFILETGLTFSNNRKLITIRDLRNTKVVKPGDVISLRPKSSLISVLFRRGSNANSLFVTERCNSFCLMCSQPPSDVLDDWRIGELHKLIELIDKEETFLGITGGEPTLLESDLFELIRSCQRNLPSTGLHILTNGRKFADENFSNYLDMIRGLKVDWAVPLYSDISHKHDFIVQSRNAFDETLRGIYNLEKKGQNIEIRVVIHKLTLPRLKELAYFIFRNMPFVKHVAFMGLEPMGFGKLNKKLLWVDPVDYAQTLEDAVYFLFNRGLNVSVYNTANCTMPFSLWPFLRKSISDWKNKSADECKECVLIKDCAGFFSSTGKDWRGRGVKAISSKKREEYLSWKLNEKVG